MGKKEMKEYGVWLSMKARCYAPSYKESRCQRDGIQVCDRWKNDFDAFLTDMGPFPGDGYCLGRLDVRGDYCPANCKWMTRKELSRQKSQLYTCNGETHSLSEWCELCGYDESKIDMIRNRLKKGAPSEDAIKDDLYNKKRNLEGKRFGYITVIGESGVNEHHHRMWECRCDCGKIFATEQNSLLAGKTKSCGCHSRILAAKKRTRHGLSHSRIWRIHKGMNERCYKTNHIEYHNYGDRGITVCDEWLGKDGLLNFYNWAMQNGYADNLSIDRIDNDKGYSPDNCRWATDIEQGRNKRNNCRIEIDGIEKVAKERSEQSGIPYGSILKHYHKGDVVDYIKKYVYPSMSQFVSILPENNIQDERIRLTCEEFQILGEDNSVHTVQSLRLIGEKEERSITAKTIWSGDCFERSKVDIDSDKENLDMDGIIDQEQPEVKI